MINSRINIQYLFILFLMYGCGCKQRIDPRTSLVEVLRISILDVETKKSLLGYSNRYRYQIDTIEKYNLKNNLQISNLLIDSLPYTISLTLSSLKNPTDTIIFFQLNNYDVDTIQFKFKDSSYVFERGTRCESSISDRIRYKFKYNGSYAKVDTTYYGSQREPILTFYK